MNDVFPLARNAAAQTDMSESVWALRWRNDALELLDQRQLPLKKTLVRCVSAAEVARAIKDMVVRGAPAIGSAAAFGIVLEALRNAQKPRREFDLALNGAYDILQSSRPTAVNLAWALNRMRLALADAAALSTETAAARLQAAAQAIYDADISTNRAIGRAGADLIADGARIMTHCNTGALATAGHGTALGMIRSARDQGKRISVIANETRPYLQGARLTAWELREEGIPVSIATDSMAGYLMQKGLVDAVLVGADRIAANADVANKIGTLGLAILAHHYRLPFYVAAPLSSIDLATATGDDIPIEHRSEEEVVGYAGLRWAPEGVPALHPAFDVTPSKLVTALVTETGVLHRPDATGLALLFARRPTP